MSGTVIDQQMYELSHFACRAAVELDKLFQGKETSLTDLGQVKDWLEKNFHGTSEYDSASFVVLRRALVCCKEFDCEERKIAKLIEKAKLIRLSLYVICENPAHYQDCHQDILEKHRTFCVELSKAASAEKIK